MKLIHVWQALFWPWKHSIPAIFVLGSVKIEENVKLQLENQFSVNYATSREILVSKAYFGQHNGDIFWGRESITTPARALVNRLIQYLLNNLRILFVAARLNKFFSKMGKFKYFSRCMI